LELQPVLAEVAESCRRLCASDHGALWLVEDDGLLHAWAYHAPKETADYDRQHPHAIDRSTAAGRAALTRAAVHIPDVDSDGEYGYGGARPYQAHPGEADLFCVKLVGAVFTVHVVRRPDRADQAELVLTFA